MFFNFSIIVNFHCVLKSLLSELKFLQADFVLEPLVYLLWCITWCISCLIWNSVSDFSKVVWKLNVREKTHIFSFSNLTSGKFEIMFWFVCECCSFSYMFREHVSCNVTERTFLVREEANLLKVFLVISDNIWSNYFFEKKLFLKKLLLLMFQVYTNVCQLFI